MLTLISSPVCESVPTCLEPGDVVGPCSERACHGRLILTSPDARASTVCCDRCGKLHKLPNRKARPGDEADTRPATHAETMAAVRTIEAALEGEETQEPTPAAKRKGWRKASQRERLGMSPEEWIRFGEMSV